MTDPYSVLGVSPDATDDQVKSAYRELAKKYHPDNYANNPLADLAAEKMKEINEAYDEVTKRRAGGSSGTGGYGGGYGNASGGYGGSSGGYSANSNYLNVRQLIDSDNLKEAQRILDTVPQNGRDAEWYFLRGSIFYKKGWTNEAYSHFRQAAGMDPSNPEYREALQRMSWQMRNGAFGGGYGGYNGGTGSGCNGCDLCAGLMCADCLCGNGC